MNYILENDKDRLSIKSYNPTSNQTLIKNSNIHLFI